MHDNSWDVQNLANAYRYLERGLANLGVPCLPAYAGFFVWADFRAFLPAPTAEHERRLFEEFVEAGVYIGACVCVCEGRHQAVWYAPGADGGHVSHNGAGERPGWGGGGGGRGATPSHQLSEKHSGAPSQAGSGSSRPRNPASWTACWSALAAFSRGTAPALGRLGR